MTIDYIALESAFLDANPDVSYWLDRQSGHVLSADDWSREQANA